MGFLSNLAKQIVGKDDEEALETIKRKAPTTLPANVPPPPTRMAPPPSPVNLDSLGPPPGTPEFNLAAMEDALRNQQAPNLSAATVGPNGETVGARYPSRAPGIPVAPTRMTIPYEGMTPLGPMDGYQPPTLPGQVTLGEKYAGMTPTQRAAAKLAALRDAPQTSKIVDTGSEYQIEAPKRMGRGEAARRGAQEGAMVGAQAGGLGGMGGGAAVGALLGLIAPKRTQRLIRERETADAQANYANELALDEAAQQNETRRIANAATIQRLQDADADRQLQMSQEQRLEYNQGLNNIGELQKQQAMLDPTSAQYAAAEQAIQAEASRLSQRTGRRVTVIPGNPKLNQLPRMAVDGQVVQQQYDGSWKPVYGTPKTDMTNANYDQKEAYDWQVKNAENAAKRESAMQAATALENEAKNRQGKVTAIAAQISALDAQMGQMGARDPQLGPLKRQREQLRQQQQAEEKGMGDAYREAEKAKAEAAKYPNLPEPPKRSKRTSGRTIQGAIEAFKKSKGREPSAQEISNMQAALQQ